MRCVRDLPILDADTYVWVPRYRVACPTCGPKLEALSWLSPWARVTSRLAESVVRLCRVLPIQHVADFYALDWDTVKTLDAAALADRLLPVDLSTIEAVAMDMTAAYEEEVRAQCPQARPSHRTALRAGTVRRCTTVVCIDARIGRMRQ